MESTKQNPEELKLLLNTNPNICRICFSIVGNDKKSFSIFNKDILNNLLFCSKELLVIEHVNIPNLICYECVTNLNIAYQFLQQITYSQDILKDFINTLDGPHLLSKVCVNSDLDIVKHESLETDNDITYLDDPINSPEIESNSTKETPIKTVSKLKSTRLKKSISCSNCDKTFRSNYDLKVHLRLHTGEKPFNCKSCGKSFADSRVLKKHEKIHSDNKQHECSICQKKFLHLFSLNSHKRVHTGERPYICDNCGKPFKTSGELTIHKRTHNAYKQFKCEVCEKCFSSKTALNTHTIIHTGAKKHICVICKRKWRTGYDLKVHMRCHTKEKPYACKYLNCDKAYKNSSQLSVHLRTHTGEKSHQCLHCSKKFGESNSLKRHLITHEK